VNATGYGVVKDLTMQSRDEKSLLSKGPLSKLIKPFNGFSIPLPPSELKKLANAHLSASSDMVINYKAAKDINTGARPVVHMHKKAVSDMYANDFIKTAGVDCFEIVSELTSRHLPRDSRVQVTDTYVDVIAETWDPYAVSRDMYGEKMVGQLAGMLKQRGLLFEDPTFPAHPVSLFQDPSTSTANVGAKQTFRKDQDPFLAGVTGIEWKRPNEIGDPSHVSKMFSGGIDPDDVAQGRLGNCYFLAAIANIATANKDLIVNDLVVEDYSDQGIYGIKFFVNGKWVTVVVDDRIPCIPWGCQWMPIFAGIKDHSGQEAGVKELWPMIFEKAWAKLHMSYESTAGGDTADASNYLTGGLITKMEIEEGISNRCWDELNAVLNPVDPEHLAFCSCNTRYDVDPTSLANTGLISGHAYSILQMKTSEINGIRYIQVRNPWGNSEWNGDWSDKSPKWTDDLKIEIGHEDEDDGTFFMSWEDFVIWFGDVQINDPTGLAVCTEGDTAQVDVFHSGLIARKTAGGSRGASTYRFNPSVELKVERDSKVELSIYQADTRSYGTDADGNQLDGQQMTLTVIDPNGSESNVIDMSPFDRVRCAKIFCVANKVYKLTVSSWAPGIECPFWVTAAGYGATLTPCPEHEPTPEEAEKMKWKEVQSFGCIGCMQPFNGESYYPMPEGPTCVT